MVGMGEVEMVLDEVSSELYEPRARSVEPLRDERAGALPNMKNTINRL